MRLPLGFVAHDVIRGVLPPSLQSLFRAFTTKGHQVDVVQWGNQPILMRLIPRTWGPVLSLPVQKIENWTGSNVPEVLGLVRHPFSHHTAYEDAALNTMLQLPNPTSKHCYVSSRLFQNAFRKCVVDEYRLRANATYHLTLSSVDLIAYLQRNGFTLTFLPETEFLKKEERKREGQSTDSILMVAPTGFEFNPETAEDNAFMSDADPGVHSTEDSDPLMASHLNTTALHEFHGLHHILTEMAGIQVHLFEHDPKEATPDAVFPNNWFTTHAEDSRENYSIVLYPIKSENRRRERRSQILDLIKDVADDKGVLDLTEYEKKGQFLEGTGSLVLDRMHRVAYVSESNRTNIDLAHHWAKQMGYEEVVNFSADDAEGRLIYHTNVLLSIGTYFAIVCLEAISDPQQGNRLMDALSEHHTVIPITRSQMSCFCGNVLELMDSNDLPVLVMSSQAFHAFSLEQLELIKQHVSKIYHTPINTIERVGGGSVRCMIAELF